MTSWLARSCFLALAALGLGPTVGQEGKAAEAPKKTVVAVVGGRLLLDPDAAPTAGTVLVEDGVITAVGPEVPVPEGARRVDATGKIVAPAFIDAGQAALVDPASSQSAPGGPGDHVAKMLVAGDGRIAERLVRVGVGAAYLDVPVRPGGKGPTGALALLDPVPDTVPLLEPLAGATFSLGVRSQGTSSLALRRGARGAITGALDSAKRYQETLRKYEDEKKAYEEKLAAWKAGKPVKAEPEAKKPDAPKAEASPADDSRMPPDFRSWPREKQREWLRERMRRREGGGGAPSAAPDDPKGDDKDGRPKAPIAPVREPANEAMLRVLEGKAPLRVEAQWREEIEIALDLAKSRGLRLTILGGADARDLGERLKEAGAVVVVPPSPSLANDAFGATTSRPGLARDLAAAGVSIAFMSAGAPGYRFDSLPLIAELAIADGLPRGAALRALTCGGAAAVGVEDRLGRLEKGQTAALQILSGAPLEPGSKVETMVLGKSVIEVGRSG